MVAGDRRIETLGRPVDTNLGVYVVRWVGKERRPARKPAPYELTVSPAPSFGHTRPLRFTLVELTDRDPALGGCDTLPHGPLDKGEDRPCMREPNLGLGRVDIDVDVVRRQPQIDHHARPAKPAATTTQNPQNRSHQQSISYWPTVDQQGQGWSSPPTARGHQALHLATSPLRFETGDLVGPTPQVLESAGGISHGRRIDQGPIGMAKDEGHIRSGQSRPPKGLLGVPKLGFGGPQKLAACRYIEKKIANLDGRTPRPRRGLGTEDSAPLNRYPDPALRRVLGGEDLEPRYRCN